MGGKVLGRGTRCSWLATWLNSKGKLMCTTGTTWYTVINKSGPGIGNAAPAKIPCCPVTVQLYILPTIWIRNTCHTSLNSGIWRRIGVGQGPGNTARAWRRRWGRNSTGPATVRVCGGAGGIISNTRATATSVFGRRWGNTTCPATIGISGATRNISMLTYAGNTFVSVGMSWSRVTAGRRI